MNITNQSFLESWIQLNCHHYAIIADVLMKQYPERDENGSRHIAIEMYKILHECIEAIGMWYHALSETAFQPEKKLHVLYNTCKMSPSKFVCFENQLSNMDNKDLLKTLGWSDTIRPKNLTDTQFYDQIKATHENLLKLFSFKITDKNTMTKMYYKCKHGGNFYISRNDNSFDINVLIFDEEGKPYDSPHFSAKQDLVQNMRDNIVHNCSRLIQTLVVFRYETYKEGNYFCEPYINY